jgi:hypothetical protein
MGGDSDADVIAGAVDANGDEIPQDHPIENPSEGEDTGDDPIAEPHPDEPGAPDPDAD